MDGKKWIIVLLVLTSVFVSAWESSREREDRRDTREIRKDDTKRLHYHSKRHMLPETEQKSRRPPRATTMRTRDMRKKPSGHLTPLQEDDMDNDEVVSVAIGPPSIRPKYDKVHWKHPKTTTTHNYSNTTTTNLIKDILVQLGREFMTRQVSEDFVFGQYIGHAMKNLTADVKLAMQHEVLELILKYQKLNRLEVKAENKTGTESPTVLKEVKSERKFIATNETSEDAWPDFSNLAKLVG